VVRDHSTRAVLVRDHSIRAVLARVGRDPQAPTARRSVVHVQVDQAALAQLAPAAQAGHPGRAQDAHQGDPLDRPTRAKTRIFPLHRAGEVLTTA
jgi:hypothetical protein